MLVGCAPGTKALDPVPQGHVLHCLEVVDGQGIVVVELLQLVGGLPSLLEVVVGGHLFDQRIELLLCQIDVASPFGVPARGLHVLEQREIGIEDVGQDAEESYRKLPGLDRAHEAGKGQ